MLRAACQARMQCCKCTLSDCRCVQLQLLQLHWSLDVPLQMVMNMQELIAQQRQYMQ